MSEANTIFCLLKQFHIPVVEVFFTVVSLRLQNWALIFAHLDPSCLHAYDF